MIKTNGAKLISINVDVQKMGERLLLDVIRYECENQFKQNIEPNPEFYIKITPAGTTLSLILPCFECFAFRRNHDSITLLLL
ncbi:hypothetical protein AGMMS49992_09160 [Clostridia bacterium]|nr:hypothetical protein AGMMS49992_09160 [Clostridia bacterium]